MNLSREAQGERTLVRNRMEGTRGIQIQMYRGQIRSREQFKNIRAERGGVKREWPEDMGGGENTQGARAVRPNPKFFTGPHGVGSKLAERTGRAKLRTSG
jgi:hypothetical protein